MAILGSPPLATETSATRSPKLFPHASTVRPSTVGDTRMRRPKLSSSDTVSFAITMIQHTATTRSGRGTRGWAGKQVRRGRGGEGRKGRSSPEEMKARRVKRTRGRPRGGARRGSRHRHRAEAARPMARATLSGETAGPWWAPIPRRRADGSPPTVLSETVTTKTRPKVGVSAHTRQS